MWQSCWEQLHHRERIPAIWTGVRLLTMDRKSDHQALPKKLAHRQSIQANCRIIGQNSFENTRVDGPSKSRWRVSSGKALGNHRLGPGLFYSGCCEVFGSGPYGQT